MILILIILLSTSLSAQNLYSEIENYLNRKIKGYDKIEFTIPGDLTRNNFRIDESRELKLKGNTAYLPVKYLDENKTFNSILTVKLKLYKLVPVAAKEIKRKERLNESSFNLQSVDVTSLKISETIYVNEFNMFRAKNLIKEGQVITIDLVEEIPAIESGAKVIAECVKGSVTISTEAIARQDGKVDEVIDILTASNELLKAKVINSYKVSIE